MTETSAPQPAPLVAGRNPGPRPALSRRAEDDAVVSARPRADGSAGGTSTSLTARPATTSGKDAGKEKAQGHSQAKTKDKDAKKAKDARKHKEKDKANHSKAAHDPEAGRDDKALVVSLPKPVRKALTHAASEHGTTPERLVALVISEWLDH